MDLSSFGVCYVSFRSQSQDLKAKSRSPLSFPPFLLLLTFISLPNSQVRFLCGNAIGEDCGVCPTWPGIRDLVLRWGPARFYFLFLGVVDVECSSFFYRFISASASMIFIFIRRAQREILGAYFTEIYLSTCNFSHVHSSLLGVLRGPLFGGGNRRGLVGFPHFRHAVVQRVFGVRRGEEALNWEQHGANLQRRRPLVFQNVEANAPELVAVRVVNLRQKADLRRHQEEQNKKHTHTHRKE